MEHSIAVVVFDVVVAAVDPKLDKRVIEMVKITKDVTINFVLLTSV